jgi:hypothetical protein
MMRKLIGISLPVAMALAFASPATALALVSPTTGQPGAPNNTCGVANGNPITPGNAANSTGSPFNPTGQAGNVYAGNPGTASLANSNSTAAVSQYDAACVRLSH